MTDDHAAAEAENSKGALSTKSDFIRDQINADRQQGRFDRQFVSRFPPEPNGFLHIGHAKSICLNFGLAQEYGGTCHLRFDDTNPDKEDDLYVQSIQEDVKWLGFEWDGPVRFASDYFQNMYDWAEQLIQADKAYVDTRPVDEIRATRGTATRPGTPSADRERSVEENLTLFRQMRDGAFEPGSHVLRAKIDLAADNFQLRDPVMYRIVDAAHHRTGSTWNIYPMYDWAHGLEDSIEGVTYSICTLEFEDHRPLYDWFLAALGVHHPQQIEFNPLNLTNTVMSKRKLLELVERGIVSGWDDPRLPTLAGLRRRGFSPEAIRNLCAEIGVSKFNSTNEYALLEHHLRQHLNATAPRVMAVLNPLKVVITNYPENEVEYFTAQVNPENPDDGTWQVPFSREIYIERDDFMLDPPKKFFRLGPGREVRLRWACLLTCDEVITDDDGEVTELRCSWDPESRGGNAPDGRRVKGTMHWISAQHAVPAEIRMYDHLFSQSNPLDVPEGADWIQELNQESLTINKDALVDAETAARPALWRCQFERIGYFCVDPDSTPEKPVLNKTVGLRDSWAKAKKKGS